MPDVEKRILFIPSQKDGVFTNLLAVSDVMLDPIHFGGQNTTHEGFSDCVARDHDEYASIAVRLGTDPAYRKHIVEKIEKTRDKVWQEDSVARQFEDFFISALETKCS